jgi:DNA-binding PadR family transcriptional regulator
MVNPGKRDPTELLPLTAAMFHVLVSLAGEERHGYAIIKDVSARTAGVVQLSTGTLYTMVKRLLADGIVVQSHRRPAAGEDDERRRYYRLTDFGRAVLAAETTRLQSMVAAARGAGVLRKSER